MRIIINRICNGHGTIINGSCICSPGYFGRDCTIENTLENRGKYSDTDSVSVYEATVCNGGSFPYNGTEANLGILEATIEMIEEEKYNENHFKMAIRN